MATPEPPPPPRRPPPELMDELVEDTLLRTPPDRPALLARAALVCKGWCRIVTDPGFRRRYHQFHGRTPPLLGFIVCRQSPATADHFTPTSSFRLPDAGCNNNPWYPLDARHGRILFLHDPFWNNPTARGLTVWTPATGERHTLPTPQLARPFDAFWNAALLCVAPGCDHMECPSSGLFNVILVGSSMFQNQTFTHAYVYSSEADTWTETASIEQHENLKKHYRSNTLVGNGFYFLDQGNMETLEYDLRKKELSVIELPFLQRPMYCYLVLMTSEEGGLGCAGVHDFSLILWSRESTTASGWKWTQRNVFKLKKSFLPVSALEYSPDLVALGDGIGVIVILAAGDAGLLAIDLKSGRVIWKISDRHVVHIIPYVTFCTPALRVSSIDEGPSVGASNNA